MTLYETLCIITNYQVARVHHVLGQDSVVLYPNSPLGAGRVNPVLWDAGQGLIGAGAGDNKCLLCNLIVNILRGTHGHTDTRPRAAARGLQFLLLPPPRLQTWEPGEETDPGFCQRQAIRGGGGYKRRVGGGMGGPKLTDRRGRGRAPYNSFVLLEGCSSYNRRNFNGWFGQASRWDNSVSPLIRMLELHQGRAQV